MLEHPNLLNVLERGLRSEDDTWRKDVVHVSDVARYGLPPEEDPGCALELWNRLRGAPRRPFTAGELLMFDRGHSLHERASELLLAGGIEKEGWHLRYRELSILQEAAAGRLGVVPDPLKDGTLDIELHGGPAGDAVLIYDYKTVRGNAFKYLPSQGPYGSHKAQVRVYAMARDADAGGILYLDREGQNFGYQAPVERDDDAVLAAAARTKAIAEATEPPPRLKPRLELKELKTQTSVYVREPHQCGRCVFRDFACPGAMTAKAREDEGKVVGAIKNGSFEGKTENAELLVLAEQLLWERSQNNDGGA